MLIPESAPQAEKLLSPSAQVVMAAMDTRQEPVKLALGQVPTTLTPSQRFVHVPLRQDDRALLLDATLNHQQTTTFILDTGATYTAISQEMAQNLGYDLQHCSYVTITTANGQIRIPKVVLKTVTLNGYTAHNVEATVMPLPRNVPFSGLLGLNFIKRHRITIDPQADRMVIEPQRS
jgi:clan AA aspartic protease (TIGR02281 family)